LSFFVSSTAKASVRPIRNKSTVPATRRDMLSKADCPSKSSRRPAGQQLIQPHSPRTYCTPLKFKGR
jgi:hypothetical protein